MNDTRDDFDDRTVPHVGHGPRDPDKAWAVAFDATLPIRRRPPRTDAVRDLAVRRAGARDQDGIVAIVRSERLNPRDLDWRRFVVAVDMSGSLAGAVQLRDNGDGSAEMASLVVRRDLRTRGVASHLIRALLADAPPRVLVITRAALAPMFIAHFGFATIDAVQAPAAVRRRRLLGQIGGGAWSLLRGRELLKLVVLDRVVR